eukprot:632529-Pelagomonas_calceolata.AAC.5
MGVVQMASIGLSSCPSWSGLLTEFLRRGAHNVSLVEFLPFMVMVACHFQALYAQLAKSVQQHQQKQVLNGKFSSWCHHLRLAQD